VKFTDQRGYYVCESTVYRILKENDLITSPAFSLMKAADRFQNPTTVPNQPWQTACGQNIGLRLLSLRSRI
jgi:hypothetical protein